MHLDAILLTHAHPDHVGGLKNGAPCDVFATSETWNALHSIPVIQRKFLTCGSSIEVGGVIFEAFLSSLSPDVVSIYDRHDEGVRRAIFSHCGSEIVAGDEEAVTAKVQAQGNELGVEANSYDGLRITMK